MTAIASDQQQWVARHAGFLGSSSSPSVPLNVARFLGNYRLMWVPGLALLALVTAAIIARTALLTARLPGGKAQSTNLLRDEALI